MWAFFLSKDNNFEKDPIALSGLHNFHNDYGLKTILYYYVQISAEKLADFVKVAAGLLMIRPPAIESWSSGKIVCGRGWLVWEENQDHLVGPWNFLMLKKKMKFVV